MRYSFLYIFCLIMVAAACQGKPEGSESAGGSLEATRDSQPADNTEVPADSAELRSPASNPGD